MPDDYVTFKATSKTQYQMRNTMQYTLQSGRDFYEFKGWETVFGIPYLHNFAYGCPKDVLEAVMTKKKATKKRHTW